MSHFTTIETLIKDIDALRAACAELNLTVVQNAQARGFGSNQHHGDYVVQLKGPYDIAVCHQSDGHYTLVADQWDGHVENEVGKSFSRLLQLYGVHKATREAQKRGLSVKRKQLANGTIKLSLERWQT